LLVLSRNPYIGLFAAVLLINLASAPVAGVLVVVRRRYG
jgi:hypothetical protein